MEKILLSACLFGKPCRYDGYDNYCSDIELLKKHFEIILICPEVDGGLSTPRLPSEIKGTKVINNQGENMTSFFIKGADHALAIAHQYGIKKAVLKEKSPSCGHLKVYDGTFQKNLINGQGITAKLLMENGIAVYNENEISDLIENEKK